MIRLTTGPICSRLRRARSPVSPHARAVCRRARAQTHPSSPTQTGQSNASFHVCACILASAALVGSAPPEAAAARACGWRSFQGKPAASTPACVRALRLWQLTPHVS